MTFNVNADHPAWILTQLPIARGGGIALLLNLDHFK